MKKKLLTAALTLGLFLLIVGLVIKFFMLSLIAQLLFVTIFSLTILALFLLSLCYVAADKIIKRFS